MTSFLPREHNVEVLSAAPTYTINVDSANVLDSSITITTEADYIQVDLDRVHVTRTNTYTLRQLLDDSTIQASIKQNLITDVLLTLAQVAQVLDIETVESANEVLEA